MVTLVRFSVWSVVTSRVQFSQTEKLIQFLQFWQIGSFLFPNWKTYRDSRAHSFAPQFQCICAPNECAVLLLMHQACTVSMNNEVCIILYYSRTGEKSDLNKIRISRSKNRNERVELLISDFETKSHLLLKYDPITWNKVGLLLIGGFRCTL